MSIWFCIEFHILMHVKIKGVSLALFIAFFHAYIESSKKEKQIKPNIIGSNREECNTKSKN